MQELKIFTTRGVLTVIKGVQ